MKEEENRPRSYQFSHMLILISFTVLVSALIGEAFLLRWEVWPLVPIVASVIFCWVMHIRRSLTDSQRLWIYCLSMMCTFFYYGVHVSSTYDLAMVIVGIIMLLTTTGEPGVVRMAVITYFITLAFDVYELIAAGTHWDGLLITRTLLHVAVVFLTGWVGQLIIRQWAMLFYQSDVQLDELNKATKRMNVFMANLSHELRTPLNLIVGMSGGLQGSETLEQLKENMETINTAGRRMEVQTDDILNYSELATGSLIINEQPCMLSSLLNDLAGSLRPIIPQNLELVIDVEADTPAVIVTDGNKLKKILWHLISNSLKYSRDGGVYVHVGCARRPYGINLLLKVSDTGVGMTEEELENVFHQFYHADSTSSINVGGLGIGLCITGGFVRAMGGFMTMDSVSGEGTTVKVSLPVAVQDERSCMAVANTQSAVVGAFMNYSKFPDPRVREFYTTTLKHIVQGLGITMHKVKSVDDLRKMGDSATFTHLFMGEDEYRSDPALFEDLAKRMVVTLVARDDSALDANSRVHLMHKPFYCFPALNALGLTPEDTRRTRELLRCTGAKALVVDDEPMNLQVATNILQRYEMDVTTVPSGADALELCIDQVFDIIFMDHMMPGMDGLETMRHIRLESHGNKYTPIVMLTANTLSASRELFSKAGTDGFVGKPINITELERVMRHVLPASLMHFVTEDEPPHARNMSAQELPVAELEAGPKDELGAQPQVIDQLAALGIDKDEGLRYCGDDEEFYRELLSQFATEADTKKCDLARSLEAKDYPSYAIVVHALKSTSKMIGADALSEMAKTLEEAAKREDMQAIEPLHPKMMRAYEELCDGLRAFIGTQTEAEDYEDEDGILEFLPDEEVDAWNS